MNSFSFQKLLLLLPFIFLLGCNTEPKMNIESSGFYEFPWPNDIRRHDNGLININNFPPASINPLFTLVTALAAPVAKGFGTNSAVFFQFTGKLSDSNFPTVEESLSPDSSIMLVNIDPTSPRYLEPTPLLIDFKSSRSLYRPSNLLTVLPYFGFTLESNTQYAAILFDGLEDDKNEKIPRAPVLDYLSETNVSELSDKEQVLQQQKTLVDHFVTEHTAWSPENVIAFTVYTTQDTNVLMTNLAQSVRAIPDEDVINSVAPFRLWEAQSTCGSTGSSTIGNYDLNFLTLDVSLPRWQRGTPPYLLSGGDIAVDENGMPQIQFWEQTQMHLIFSCDAPPNEGKSVVVRADGTGADFDAADWVVIFHEYANRDFEHIALSVSPHFTGDRIHPLAVTGANLLRSLGFEVDDQEVAGNIYANLFNLKSKIGGAHQGAADYLYLKRLGENLQAIVEQKGIQDENYKDLDLTLVSTNPDRIGISGQSQGSNDSPLALAVEEWAFAQLNAAGAASYATLANRGQYSYWLTTFILGLSPEELDMFHPIAHIMQTIVEPIEPSNYAPDIKVKDMLITAGYHDGCVLREDAEAFATALARHGNIKPAHTQTRNYFFAMNDLLGIANNPLPFSEPNLPDGRTSSFYMLEAGHGIAGNDHVVGEFLFNVTNGDAPTMLKDEVPGDYWECDTRVRQHIEILIQLINRK